LVILFVLKNNKIIMGLYYRIWVDSIMRLLSKEASRKNWQLKSIATISVAMTFNFVLLMTIIQKVILNCYFYEFNLPVFSNYENYIFTLLFLYFLPCVVVNYLLIFRGKRYEKLLKKYPNYNGKLFAFYFLISLFLPVALIWIGIIFSK